MAHKVFAQIFICTAFLLFSVEINYACTYGQPYPSACQIYAESEYVVIGEVKKIAVKAGEFEKTQKITVDVLQTFKGKLPNQILVKSVVSACLGYDFEKAESVGKKYLLYLRGHIKNKELAVYEVGSVKDGSSEMGWLNGLPASLGRTLISGEIVQHDSKSRMFDFVKNIAGAKVKIFDEKNTYNVLTDENGRYEVWDLPAGKYRIAPEYPFEYGLIFPMTYGSVEFKTLDKDRTDRNDFTVEAAPGTCGGANFLVDIKENLRKSN